MTILRHLSISVLLLFILAAGLMAGEAKLSEEAPDFTLKDAKGNTHSLSDFEGKWVVLEWVNYGCPFVAKHYDSGNMQKLQKEYTEKGVVWLSVCSSAPGKQGHFESDKIRELKKEKAARYTAYLIDEDGKVGKMYDAKTTPHMYIITPGGKLVYMGAIDDKPSTKLKDVETAENYVTEILDAALAGKEFENKITTAYGCSVKY